MSLRIRNDQYLEDLIGVVAQPVNLALGRMREEDSKVGVWSQPHCESQPKNKGKPLINI